MPKRIMADLSLDSAEAIKLLAPFRIPDLPSDRPITVHLGTKMMDQLKLHVRKLNEVAEAEGIKLETTITPESVVKVLIYWYLATEGGELEMVYHDRS